MISFHFFVNSPKGYKLAKTWIKPVKIVGLWTLELEANINKTNWAEFLVTLEKDSHRNWSFTAGIGIIAGIKLQIFKRDPNTNKKAVHRKIWPWPTAKQVEKN